MSREQGDIKIHLGSTKNCFGEHQEYNLGSQEKRVKFQREPGAGDPPLWGLINQKNVNRLSVQARGHQVQKVPIHTYMFLMTQYHWGRADSTFLL